MGVNPLFIRDLRSDGPVDWVQEYADYRASETGGSFKPVIADVDQLYDQFAFGVDRHFIAFRNFLQILTIMQNKSLVQVKIV